MTLMAKVPVDTSDGCRLADNADITVYDNSGVLATGPVPAKAKTFGGVLFWFRVAEALEPLGYALAVRNGGHRDEQARPDGTLHFTVRKL